MPQQLLDAQRPAEIHVHAGQVIEPVGVGQELARREVLADLLRRAVQIADVRRDFGHHFAVGPQRQPQHAVRAGMLRAHVDEHLVRLDVELDGFGLCMRSVSIDLPRRDPVILDGHHIILPQRMAHPILRAEDAPQIGMPEKRTPDRSNTSRSCHSAVRQTPLTLGTSGNWPGSSSSHRGRRTFSTSRWRCTVLER